MTEFIILSSNPSIYDYIDLQAWQKCVISVLLVIWSFSRKIKEFIAKTYNYIIDSRPRPSNQENVILRKPGTAFVRFVVNCEGISIL